MIRSWDNEKNKLLEPYGFTIKDDLTGKFKFEFNKGTISLIKLDRSITRAEDWNNLGFLSAEKGFSGKANSEDIVIAPAQPEFEIAWLIYSTREFADFLEVPDFQKRFVRTSQDPKNSSTQLVESVKLYDVKISPEDIEIEKYSQLLSKENLMNFIRNRKLLDKSKIQEYNKLTRENFNNESLAIIQDYIRLVIERIISLSGNKEFLFSENPKNSRNFLSEAFTSNLIKLDKHQRIKSSIVIRKTGDSFEIVVRHYLTPGDTPVRNLKQAGAWFAIQKGTAYLFDSYQDSMLCRDADAEGIALKFRDTLFGEFASTHLNHIAEKAPVQFENLKIVEIDTEKPSPKIYLDENLSELIFKPVFEYQIKNQKTEISFNGKSEYYHSEGQKLVKFTRHLDFEQEIIQFVRSLHPRFESEKLNHEFRIRFDEILVNNWFINVFEEIRKKEIPVFGYDDLKKIKYNIHRPTMKFRTSSGIDWFDLKMEITFGDQLISLKEVRKAIINKSSYVLLGDGTIGILPEEWLMKYQDLFIMGTVKNDEIKLSKLHFQVIDELASEVDNEAVIAELNEKKQKLLNFREIKSVNPPKSIFKRLRNYQVEGFRWLNFLSEYGFGGCLADDMGLGKTVQILALLAHFKSRNELSNSLVVVPTTLIFNWVNEIEKFAPQLKYNIHRGTDRVDDISEFPNYDLIITTYGTLRKDITLFADHNFHFVILDESQAIKNPAAQISKAVKSLKARQKIIMTGTPVENNTFDLYSQMDFLNPGFLGSQEAFNSNFAKLIDKEKDEAVAERLRKMIYPFLLKRTKEEVARELPEKTETILYCEMGKLQRKVYESYRKKYREEIESMMVEKGMNNSGFLILEGLLKLRQICNSPALLNDREKHDDDSVKLEELTREISENAGQHKILVFSQFLGMLDLVKKKLESMNIGYEYLDGQTQNRKKAVDQFMTDNSCRVFLISLKAGGLGINLTEADYVYLVDPWWNPAVEKQAIDRTHRIGQTKKVFAYKMICKDTIEEKILHLQEQKKLVAKNLISVDAGFFKKLNENDIKELFS